MAELIGANKLRARFRAVEKAPRGMMRTLGVSAVGHQKNLAPVRTGNLRRSIHLDSSSATHATTVASANYAAHVEFGTAAHVIRPRRRKALRFKGDHGVVFAKRVNHPGTRAQPFMLPGAKKALDDVGVKAIVDAWNGAA